MLELLAKLLDLPLGYFLIVIAVILLLVAGVGKFKGLIDPGKSGRIFSGVIGIPLVIIGLVLSVGFSSITPGKLTNTTSPPSNIYATPTSPPSQSSSTVALKTLPVNRQLVCTGNCDAAVIKITVVSFTLDPTQNQTSMLLLLNSQHNYSNCHFVQASTSYLVFQDSTGKTYDPGGQVGNGFSLVAGQPLQLTAIYSFLPSSGSAYTLLSSEIWGDSFPVSGPIYGTTQFTF